MATALERPRRKARIPPANAKPSASEAGLRVGLEASWFLFALLIAKDWLVSSADPFPYRPETMALADVTIGLWGLLSPRRLPPGAMACVTLSVWIWFSAGSFRSVPSGWTDQCPWLPGALPILAGLTVAMAALGATRLGKRPVLSQACRALVLLTIAACLLPIGAALMAGSWSDQACLGAGMGTAHATSFGGWSATAHDFGTPVLAAVPLVAVFAVRVGLRQVRESIAPAASLAIAAGLGGMAAILADEAGRHALLALNCPSAVLLLACSVVSVGTACPARGASVARQDRTAGGEHGPKRVPAGRRLAAMAFAAVVVVMLGAALTVQRRVAALKTTGAPPASAVSAAAAARHYRDIALGRDAFVPLSGISQAMQDATVAMEDGGFYRHGAVDPAALHRALRADVRAADVRQGGSTITQQLAKNLFLTGDRSVWRKLEEAAFAFEIDRRLSKERILELYLNTIDYGMGHRGIASAARGYFHKTPAELTVAESAILVGIAPDPMQRELDLDRVQNGERAALGRMAHFFPERYGQAQMEQAQNIPVDRLIYPDKDAWDRHATDSAPAVWHGVAFYFFADPDIPGDLDRMATCLKERLPAFLAEARQKYSVTGIDHLGVYNDRSTRQSNQIISAHAFGQAIDISGFRFADGTRVRVADHADPAAACRLGPLEALLKRHFDIVVDWNEDPARHGTHFHVEVKGRRNYSPRSPYDTN